MFSYHDVSLSSCNNLTVTTSSCHNVSVIMSLSYCHNVSLLVNLGSKCLSVTMSLCHSESCSTSIPPLMLIEAKYDSELADMAFDEAGCYGKGSKCLSKGRKESTLEVIDVI